MTTNIYTMRLEKQSLRRLDARIMKEQLSYIVQRALGGTRGKTWALHENFQIPTQKSNGEGYVYSTEIPFIRKGKSVDQDILNRQWDIIQEIANTAGKAKGWNVITKDINSQAARDLSSISEQLKKGPITLTYTTPKEEEKTYTKIQLPKIQNTINEDENFKHLYDRDAQISIVYSAIQAFIDSNHENRFHGVLYGAPACGKTEILRSFARWLGPEAVLNFDATSTTKAGAEKILLESQNVPPILMVEEIEKTEEMSLRWLLGVLDHRGEIRKITNRMQAQRSVKLLCLATVNDMELFSRVMDGALASRFAHKIYCPRPNRHVLEKILQREINVHGGNQEWIKPTLDFCLDTEQTTDPRRIIAVCMSGKDKLLDGSYQEFLAKTMAPKNNDFYDYEDTKR